MPALDSLDELTGGATPTPGNGSAAIARPMAADAVTAPLLAVPPTLERRLGRRTWLARTAAGDPVVASQLGVYPEDLPASEWQRRQDAAVRVRAAGLCPALGVVAVGDEAWVLSEPRPGVDLARLLGHASLTPEQAAFVAAGLLAAVAALHADGREHLRLRPEKVRVDPRGGISLTGWACATFDEQPPDRASGTADLPAVAELLAALLKAARYRGSQPDADPSAGLRARLAEAVDAAAAGTATPGQLAQRLDGMLGSPARRRRVYRELAALVEAVRPDDLSLPPPAAAPRRRLWWLGPALHRDSGRPEPPRRDALHRQPPHGDPLVPYPSDRDRGAPGSAPAYPVPQARAAAAPPPHRIGVGLWAKAAVGLLVLAVLGGLVSAEAVFLNNRIINDVRTLLGVAPAKAAPAAHTATSAPRPLAGAVTPATGPVSLVDLRVLGPCHPGGTCRLRVAVHGHRVAVPTAVAWTVLAQDRCPAAAAAGRRLAHGTVVLRPGLPVTYAVTAARLPAAAALALRAAVQSPAHASSAAVAVPTQATRC